MIALALLLAHPARAADPDGRTNPYSVSTWTIDNGLPQGTINDILQTADGALWIATNGGLLRFDGVEFRTFDYDTLPGLPSVRITGLEHDGEGGLWILTQRGSVLPFREGKLGAALVAPNPDNEDMLGFVFDPGSEGGTFWLRGNLGGAWRHSDSSWTKPFGESELQRTFGGVCIGAQGRVVLGRGAQLLQPDESAEDRRELTAPDMIIALAPAGPERLWVGLRSGLALARGNSIERLRLDPPLEMRVTALAEDGVDGVWCGTDRGVYHVVKSAGGNSWSRDPDAQPLLPNFIVQSLLVDREGNLWVGSRGQGLARVSRGRVEAFKPSGREAGVAAIASDGVGGAWISYANRNLYRARLAPDVTGEDALAWTSEETEAIFALLRGSDGSLWSSRQSSLVRDRNGARTTFALPPKVGAIVETVTGEIWVSVGGGTRLVRLGPNGEVTDGLDLPEEVISLAADFEGGFWIGGTRSVFHYTNALIKQYGQEEGLPKGDVRSLLAERDGSVWIATYGGGLAHLQKGVAKRIARSQGLPNLSLSNIQDDGLGRLWLLSNQGLIVAQRDELRALVDGRIARFDPVVIGPTAGMPEANFGTPSGAVDTNGRLWFGTIEGPVRVDPRQFPFNKQPLRVHVERVLADSSDLELDARVQVPAGTSRLEFKYTTFALTAPERVHFRYRLDGYDDEWNEVGSERKASYTGLKPRHYTFYVEARNEDGVWSGTSPGLDVAVAPSWYESNWFVTGAVLFGLALVYAVDRIRVRRLGRRARVLLEATEGRARAEERESRLREELAHIGRVAIAGELATSLAHEVNQPLAAIVTNAQAGRRYLTHESVDKRNMDEILRDIAQQGQRASDIIKGLREFLRKKQSERRPVALNTIVRDTLPLVRREIQDHRIDLVLNLAPDLAEVDVDPIQVQQVVVNLVKNACEAMSDMNGERTLEVRTTGSDRRVILEVQDTGPGLAPDVAERLFQPYVTTKSTGMGLGLAICRSIVEAHGGRISADSAGNPGTTFRVDLPGRADGS